MTSDTKNTDTKNTDIKNPDQEALTKAQQLAEAAKAKANTKGTGKEPEVQEPEVQTRISSRTEAEMRRGREVLDRRAESMPKPDPESKSSPMTIITDN